MPLSAWNLHSNLHSPTPFEKRRLRQISAYHVSTIRGSGKSSIMTNRKSITGFPTSYRWSAYGTPKSPKMGFIYPNLWYFFTEISTKTIESLPQNLLIIFDRSWPHFDRSKVIRGRGRSLIFLEVGRPPHQSNNYVSSYCEASGSICP